MTRTRPVVLNEVTTLRWAVRIAWRWVRAFSTAGEHSTPVAWLCACSMPLLWWANLLAIGVYAGNVVHDDAPIIDPATRTPTGQTAVAAVIAPNPVARAQRRLWRAVTLAVNIVMAAGAAVGLAAGTASYLSGLILVVLVVVLTGTAVEKGPALRAHRAAGDINKTKTDIMRRHPEAAPVVVLSTLGAWPPGQKLGWPLFDAVLEQYRQTGVSMVLLARNEALATQYVARGGVVLDPAHPLHIGWITT